MFEHKALAVLLLAACLASTITARVTPSEQDDLTVEQRGLLQNIISRVGSFSFEIFSKFQEKSVGKDFIVSPITIWTILLLIAEGASGSGLQELQNTLRLGNNQHVWRQAYKAMQTSLNVKSPDVNVSGMQAFFTNTESPFGHEFSTAMTSFYDANLVPVNFSNSNDAAARINEKVRRTTDNFLDNVISADDLKDIELVILSILYFKAKWQEPFLQIASFLGPFYNEEGTQIDEVQTMRQFGVHSHARIDALNCSVVEKKYGEDGRFSMLLILPNAGVSVSTIVGKLPTIDSAQILDELKNNKGEIFLQMPKFTVSSSFTVNDILREMGLNELFQEGSLQNITPSAKISKVVHKTKISVNEEGSSAAAVAEMTVVNQSIPPSYVFNRPFVYLIMDTTTKFPLFCGQVMHPRYEEKTM